MAMAWKKDKVLQFDPVKKWRAWSQHKKFPKMLNLGCGTNVRPGWTNLDLPGNEKADVHHDLEKYPYPFKDNTFDIILISHVLEHLHNPIKVINELHRILAPGGLLIIKVPHYAGNAAWIDVTHVRPYAYGSLQSFLEDKFNNKVYNTRTFGKIDITFGFWMRWYYPWNYIVKPFANWQPIYYETALANIFPPFELIHCMYKR